MRPHRARAGFRLWAALGLLSGLAGEAGAAPVAVADPVGRDGAPLEASLAAAFRAGAEEANDPAVTPNPHLAAALDAAAAELAKGEDEYLKAHLRTAEKALQSACDGFMADAMAPSTERATRASLLLAEVQLALNRTGSAEKTLERALALLPEFPGAGAAPAPEVMAVIERLRPRLSGQLGATLAVTSDVAGTQVSLAGVALGVAPVTRGGLPQRAYVVELAPPGRPPVRRRVDLAPGAVAVRYAEAVAQRAALARAAAEGDPDEVLTAAAALQAETGLDTACAAVVDEDTQTAIVARLDGTARRFLGGQRAAAPDGPSGWRALGRFCGRSAGGNLDAAAAARRLRGGVGPDEAAPGARPWRVVSYVLMGAGAAALGAGGYFGVEALSGEQRYAEARSPGGAADAADSARRSALFADLGLGGGALLAGAGLVLLWLDPDAAPEAVQSASNSP